MKDYFVLIADEVKNFLDKDDWNYHFDEEKGIFDFGLNLKGTLKNIRYLVDVKQTAFNVFAVSPVSADKDDEEMMKEMAEFVCRANYGLSNGNFELDFRDGELRYKCHVDCEGIIPSYDMVKNNIMCPAAMFGRYGKGILQIIFNHMTASEAIDLCEGKEA